MAQKIIWMFCSIIGINILIILFSSCGKKIVETPHYVKYKYTNNSNHEVLINSWQKLNDSIYTFKYLIEKNKTFEQNIEFMSGSVSGLIIYADSVKLSFDNDIEKVFTRKPSDTSKYNLLILENYSKTKTQNGEELSYFINDNDYKNAIESRIVK